MAGAAGQISGDVIDAIRPDLEAFACLWSALRTNYQGTNITKTVARLLHMYQPDDGVLAYERLLRTLYVLLEDFDCDGLRLLVSMVPPPKGVPDQVIREVFHKATGFVRLNAPIFHRNNVANSESDAYSSSSAKISDGNSDSRSTIASNETPRLQTVLSSTENAQDGATILRAIVKADAPAKSNKSPKVRPRDTQVFRGFPSNEITNTQSHARNMTNFYGPATNFGGYPQSQRYVDYRDVQGQSAGPVPRGSGMDPSAYRVKWLEPPLLVRKNNYDVSAGYSDLILKTSDNKFIRLPITKINGPPIAGYNSAYSTPIQTAYQAYFPNSQIHLQSSDCSSDPTHTDLSRKTQNNYLSKKSFEEGEKTDGAVEENLVKSRVAHVDHDYGFTRSHNFSAEKENFEIENLGSPNSETIEKFRDTVKNSQRAIQEDIYRMDVVRCEEDVIQTNAEELNTLNMDALTATKELKKSVTNFLRRAEEEKSLESPQFPRTKMLQGPENCPTPQLESSPRIWKHEGFVRCKDSDKFEDFSIDCCEYSTKISSSPINPNASKTCRGRFGRNQSASKSEKISQKTANCTRNSSHKNCERISSLETNEENAVRSDASSMESVIGKSETMHQPNTISEMVNYRKQYYDALLSIQRAKVAVANSLAISSSQTSTSYDPRVFQYLQQQHQLLQQQQRLMMGPQHPVTRQTIVQPSFSNMRGTAGLWIRGSSDWKYSSCGQYAFPRQTYPVSSSSSSCPVQVAANTASESSMSENPSRNSHHPHRASKPSVKRRKLEDIVGKLKETDTNS